MKPNSTRTIATLITVSMVCTVVVSFNAVAGDLEPDTAPAPTMKTLDEVEPRIPILRSVSPADTVTITQSGSYYLIGDRYCSYTGIRVDTDNVTIDLMGYSLIG